MESDFGFDYYQSIDFKQDYADYTENYDDSDDIRDNPWDRDKYYDSKVKNAIANLENYEKIRQEDKQHPYKNGEKHKRKQTNNTITYAPVTPISSILTRLIKSSVNFSKHNRCSDTSATVMAFYSMILNCDLKSLKAEQSNLTPYEMKFVNKHQYYDMMMRVVVEECKHAILNSSHYSQVIITLDKDLNYLKLLQSASNIDNESNSNENMKEKLPNNASIASTDFKQIEKVGTGIPMLLTNAQALVEDYSVKVGYAGEMVMLEVSMTEKKRDEDFSKPGGIYALRVKTIDQSVDSDANRTKKRRLDCHAGTECHMEKHEDLNDPGPNISQSCSYMPGESCEMYAPSINPHYVTIMGCVAQGTDAVLFSKSGDAGYNRYCIPLWICIRDFQTHLLPILKLSLNSSVISPKDEYVIQGTLLCGVISLQRMATCCMMMPEPPFLYKLFGLKPSNHIRFDITELSGRGVVAHGDNVGQESVPEGHMAALLKVVHSITGAGGRVGRDIEKKCNWEYVASLNPPQFDILRKLLCSSFPRHHDDSNSMPASCVEMNSGMLEVIQGPPGCGKTRFLVALLHTYEHILSWNAKSCESDESDPVNAGLGFERHILVCAPSNKAVSVLVTEYLNTHHRSLCNDKHHRFVDAILVGVEEKTNVKEFDKLPKERSVQNTIDLEVHENVAPEPENNLLTCFVQKKISTISTISNKKGFIKKYVAILSEIERLPLSSLFPKAILRRIRQFYEPMEASDIYVYTYMSRLFSAVEGCCSIAQHCHELMSMVEEDESSMLSSSAYGTMYILSLVYGTLVELRTQHYAHIVAKLERNMPCFFGKVLKNTANLVSNRLSMALQLLKKSIRGCCNTIKYDQMHKNFEEDRKDRMDLDVEEISEELLSNSMLVFCTLASSGCGIMKRCIDHVELLLVDEAGQAMESELIIPYLCEPRNMVLVGDPKQLPPTMQSNNASRLGYNMSCIERLMVHLNYPHSILSIQYRMHPAISQLPIQLFYEGLVSNAPSTLDVHTAQSKNPVQNGSVANEYQNMRQFLNRVLHGRGACGTITPSSVNNALNNNENVRYLHNYQFVNIEGEEVHRCGKSIYNSKEAKYVIELCVQLSKLIILQLKHEEQVQTKRNKNNTAFNSNAIPSISIITFYSAQVDLLKRYIHEQCKEMGRTKTMLDMRAIQVLNSVRVVSVDSFQGSEADIVFLSFVRSNNAKHSIGFLKDFQRLNVAITRAKHVMFAVGDQKALSYCNSNTNNLNNVNKAHHFVHELLVDAQKRNCILDAYDLLSHMMSHSKILSAPCCIY